MKRKYALWIALIMVCTIMLGSGAPVAVGAKSTSADVDPFGKFDPPITVTGGRILTSWMSFDEGEDLDNNWWMRTFREQLGINVEWSWTAPNWGEPYEQKIYTSLATDDLPDYMCVYGTIYKRLVDAGKLEDLTEAYETYASPYLKETMEADENLILNGGTVDGQLLAVGLPEGFNSNFNVIWIRKDWLDNLNLPVPTTFEELEATALAFTTQDPDGNGKDDTYGFPLDKEIRIDPYLNMFDVNIGWVEKDGELVPSRMNEELKVVWQKFADWYKQGIISNEFAIKDVNNELVQDLINGKFGIKMDGSSADPQMKDQHKTYPESEWTFIPTPSISGGVAKQWARSRVQDFNVVTTGGNTEAAIKMLNLMLQCYSATDKPAFVDSYDYQNTAAGSLSFFMCPFRMSPRDISRPNLLLVRECMESGGDPATLPYEGQYVYNELTGYEAGNDEFWGSWMESKEGGANDMRWKYIEEGYLYFDPAYWMETSAEAEFGGGLSTRYMEFATKAIMQDDVENQWNAWVDFYMTNGGAEIIAENNEMYQLYNK